MSATVAENIKRTIHTTINALNAWDYDALVAVRADEFKFQGLPRSLDMPEMDNQAFRDHWFNFMTPSLKDFKIEPVMQMQDATTLRSTVYSRVSATLPGSNTFKDYEIVQMFTLDETGEKLLRLDEFFDSKVYMEMSSVIKGHMAIDA
ncbi:hypothetical protein KC332_g1182 [Hortaea werneckii]|uniref:SnoaL-like domain-containing protein n=1 Tax=Hortaea werneckii TaxID=91943 RepID=A0A3M7GMM4_HORWE|nr:hypothetical protein KC358_g8758 [Hortaea werneckii]KAI6824452.1 hypothetical protein KC350_g8999 [Hortaea werneckii]KAI6932380.1 hypothetical protein KC341_g9015 [Hortaea werneckii]KAI6933119.1 hypothetical protein KC348_g6832 [Hortaea werneckii]KAI6971537.1 hypothetical protein KC321_g6729 [Hortaea werneckii]